MVASTSIKKRIIIVGASILQLPAIIKAKEMGLYVGVVDFNPQAIGVSYADEYFNVSTVDEVGIYEVAKNFKADGIMTLATDMPMRSVAYTCEKLGLPGISYKAAVQSTDKAEMIKTFEDKGVEHPWYFVLDSTKDLGKIKDRISYPCITKPTDSAGSRGVMIVNSEEELVDALKYSSKQGRNGEVIIEEYMNGEEVSVEIIVSNGRPHVLAVTDKLTTGPPHFIEIGHSQHSQLEFEEVESIKELAKRAVRAVGIETGPAHVEIMLTESGPKMIELGSRMGGGSIASHLVPLSTGIDMIENTIRLTCNEEIDISPKFKKGSAMRSITATNGKLVRIDGLEKAMKMEGIEDILVSKNEGDILADVNDNTSRLIYVIAQADTVQEAIKRCEKAIEIIKIDIDSCNCVDE